MWDGGEGVGLLVWGEVSLALGTWVMTIEGTMSLPVIIENEKIKMEVYPSFGGKVASIVDKADKFELLFNYPAELPTAPHYDTPYSNSWFAGWDECFPAIAPSRYVGHPYDGAQVPDHGELWGIPTTAVPTREGITTVWHGLRFGYRLTRKLFLDGSAVQADYTLINLAPFEFRYVWAMHALMSLASPVRLVNDSPGLGFRFSHNQHGEAVGETMEWPISQGMDFSAPAGLPARRAWKLFSTAPIDQAMGIEYPERGRKVSISYSGEESGPGAYWGLWINTGGWGGHQHFAVEPTTGRSDELDKSIRDGSAGRLSALGRREWTVRWTLGDC